MTDSDSTIAGQTAARVYDDIYKHKTIDKIQVCPDEMLVRMVRGRLKTLGTQNVLDAGCGEGRNALMMAAEGLKVSCLDILNPCVEAGNEASRRPKFRNEIPSMFNYKVIVH